jgi:hypothetical protein
MVKNQTFFNFKRGDVVDAWGDLAIIIDVLRSEFTNNVTVYVRFVRNIGDSRPFDILTISPDSPQGTEAWALVSKATLLERIAKRQQYIQGEIDKLLALVEQIDPQPLS